MSRTEDNAADVFNLTEVRFGYTAGCAVIDGLSAALRPGRLCALVGPNAAGKSTLLRLMLGQAEPDAGRVELLGRGVSDWSASDRARTVSYVPQRPSATLGFTVAEVVAMGRFAMQRLGFGLDAESRRAVEHAIDACALGDLRDRVIGELSIGQQQRVVLARAVAQADGAGRAMLLDEPGSAMDLKHLHAMMRLLVQLARGGMAVLVVAHDLNLAARYADDVWLLDEGRLVAAGAWDAVLTPEVLEPVFGVTIRRMCGISGETERDRPVFDISPSATLTATR